jgi:hypothetical protein
MELREDFNDLASHTVATLRAVINDDEDAPFWSASRVRRHRLQLLHRPLPGGVACRVRGVAASGAASRAAGKERETDLRPVARRA